MVTTQLEKEQKEELLTNWRVRRSGMTRPFGGFDRQIAGRRRCQSWWGMKMMYCHLGMHLRVLRSWRCSQGETPEESSRSGEPASQRHVGTPKHSDQGRMCFRRHRHPLTPRIVPRGRIPDCGWSPQQRQNCRRQSSSQRKISETHVSRVAATTRNSLTLTFVKKTSNVNVFLSLDWI